MLFGEPRIRVYPALLWLLQAYSVYDEEVGYCQGLSFVAAALLLHVSTDMKCAEFAAEFFGKRSRKYTHTVFFGFQMPEEQAFCVLVKMMFDYGLRDLFKQGFEELHLRFYQLERLMQVGEDLPIGISSVKTSSSPSDDAFAHCDHRRVSGSDAGPVRALHGAGTGGAHVRLPVVPHSLHGQVPLVHGVPHSRHLPVRGRDQHIAVDFVMRPEPTVPGCVSALNLCSLFRAKR